MAQARFVGRRDTTILRQTFRITLGLCGCFLGFGFSTSVAQDPASNLFPEVRQGPLSPQQSLAALQVAPGLRVELVAADPLVADPVAIAFDEDGRLWVVEMADYPDGPAPGQAPLSRIRCLQDRDGDGRYDLSRIFAHDMLFPNGILPWKGGVIVTAAPAILFLKDTDGDGRADLRQVLFEGFATENPQLRVNHPTFGLDNWVYVANGLRGGAIRVGGSSESESSLSVNSRDFRFRLTPISGQKDSTPMPTNGEVQPGQWEAIAGPGQFGLTFDDWGRRFVCDNRHHLRLVVMEDRYTRRNPFLAAPELMDDIPEHGAAAEVFPLGANWTTSSLHRGTFTACCGVHVYRGDLLPVDYYGNAFVCEPPGSLVHRDLLQPAGASLRAKRDRAGVEFLASSDDWFRPVNLTTGPDGALYIADMYRAIIEHPEFMPDELKGRPELALGRNLGRIYRIVPDGDRPNPPRPKLSQAATEELVALLAHPNAWWRETAQRLLIERQDRTAGPLLQKLMSQSPSPLGRVHAAWTLEGLGLLDASLVRKLLEDTEPRVREQGLVLAELLPKDELPSLSEPVSARFEDDDSRIRFQTALTLGQLLQNQNQQSDSKIPGILSFIGSRDAEDRWTRLAVVSSVPQHAGHVFHDVLALHRFVVSRQQIPQSAAGRLELMKDLASVVAARRDPAELEQVLNELLALKTERDRDAFLAGLQGIVAGVQRRGGSLKDLFAQIPQDRREPLAAKLTARFHEMADFARKPDAPLPLRLAAVELLQEAPAEIAVAVLSDLLQSHEESQLQRAVVRSLAAQADEDVMPRFIEHWVTATPAVRREMVAALLRTPQRTSRLLDEIERGRISPAELDAGEVRRLLEDRQPELRERANRLLSSRVPEERRTVLERFQASLKLSADPQRGRAIFEKNCATCHRVAGLGVDVAPDIADTRERTPQALLNDILNPNAAIDANYIQYTVVTQGGRVLNGVVASETASSITLRRAENQSDIILRQDVAELYSNGKSLMPEGLEKDISVEDMAHLIGFLKNWRYVEGGE